MERPEQKKTEHDLSDVFKPANAVPSSDAIGNQPDHGGMTGFDLYSDAVGAAKPGMTFEEIYKHLVAGRPKANAAQQQLLESRYDLAPKFDPTVKMFRGKPDLRRADGPAAAGSRLGRARRDEPGRRPAEKHLPLQDTAASGAGWRARRPGLPAGPDQDVPPPAAVRHRFRRARGLLLPEFPPAIFLQNLHGSNWATFPAA